MKTSLLAACLLTLTSAAALAATSEKYTPGLSIATEQNLRNICAVSVAPDDTLLVAADGQIRLFDPATGKFLRSFPTGVTRAEALTTDGKVVYLFATTAEPKVIEQGSRKIRTEVRSTTCKRYAWSGEPMPDLAVEPKMVTAARFVNGKLYLADLNRKVVHLVNPQTGETLGRVGRDLRICCGIFDVNVEKNDVLIANLGAFRVQRYDASGKILSEFGRRGQGDDAFQGCCNPVSAAALPNGCLITVEKDPSRVKVYQPDGKLLQVLPKLEELVEGCQRVSIAVDSKGRVYLAVNSKRHFVLQYVPQAS